VRPAAASWDDEEVQRLTTAQQAELRARYEGDAEPGTPPSTADVSVVLVARDPAGTAVGCGALRALSTVLLAGLEDVARSRGWTVLRLETGPRQPEAIALYEGAGYRPIPAFGGYVDEPDAGCSLYYERVLGPA
jgi:GNAT superfamily N-acetyltransferase